MTQRPDIEKLFKKYYAQMHRQAAMLLHDDDLARDIVHDVFCTLLDGNIAVSVLTPSYLLRAVRNRCINHIRDLDIHERVLGLYFAEMDDYDGEDWPDEDTVSEIYSIIRDNMPEQCQRVVELRFVDGLKFEAVACEMGISQTAVFKHLRHALSIIRNKLSENG